MRYFSFLFLLLFSTTAFSQIHNSVVLIPENLKKDAYAVVRNSDTEFTYKSEKSALEKISTTITVLDKKGKDLADFMVYGDKFRELKKFSAVLSDGNGNSIKKYKLSDVFKTEISEGLATDGVYYLFSCDSPTYPFTIQYEYEIEWKNGIFRFPVFMPQNNYNLSVEKSTYTLLLPENVEFRTKFVNMEDHCSKNINKGILTCKWQVNDLEAIEQEAFAPNLTTLVPMLFLSPTKFIHDKVPGEITDWHSYGAWVNKLMENRGELPENCKKKVIELTSKTDDKKEKIKILYDYLGESTRYVSIQLGIGGFQPMPAAEVCKTGFGDCKGLSFYLKSMLNLIDIPSNYVEIRSHSSNKSLMKDYANFHETNHAILQVPLERDTLWLECTNTNLPFGFVHNRISGHDAIEINEKGGRFCTLPDYPDSLNIEKNDVSVILSENGNAQVKAEKSCKMKIYDNYMGFSKMKLSEQNDFLRKSIKLPNASLSNNIKISEVKNEHPELSISYEWETDAYGNKTGSRLFIPLNPYRSSYNWFTKPSRKQDIFISTGFLDIDSFKIKIPENYELETLPKTFTIENKFGKFVNKVSCENKEIMIEQRFFLSSGNYKSDEYQEIKTFLDKINESYKERIIIKKTKD